jgi:hypothetical protein
MTGSLRAVTLVLALSAVASAAKGAAVFQFEALGASQDWIVLRENIQAAASDTAACSYPGLDPSQHVGVRVHFVRLTAEAKRGRLMLLETPDSSMMYYTPARPGGCTSAADAEQRWREIGARAKSFGIVLSQNAPIAIVLGGAVPAETCVLLDRAPCRQVYDRRLSAGNIRIAVSLTAVPEAPDERTCQFVGHRFGTAIQVSGLDFGTLGGVAPGGFANHYDCREQQFDPLRLYQLDGIMLLVGDFRGANIADRAEHPFLIVFPAQ